MHAETVLMQTQRVAYLFFVGCSRAATHSSWEEIRLRTSLSGDGATA